MKVATLNLGSATLKLGLAETDGDDVEMRAARDHFGERPMVAVFDTGFHADRPEPSTVYPLPRRLTAPSGRDARPARSATVSRSRRRWGPPRWRAW